MSSRRGGRLDDAGQTVTALMVFMVLALCLLVVRILLPIGAATDVKERTQAAADAAALAAAQDIKAELLTRFGAGLADRTAIDSWVLCGSGRNPAADYAGRNNARVTSYCYVVAGDRVEVSVQGLTPVNGAVPAASAVAEVGIAWGSCRWKDDVLPLLTTHWLCGSLDIPFEVDLLTGKLVLDHTLPPGWLDKQLVPRLVT